MKNNMKNKAVVLYLKVLADKFIGDFWKLTKDDSLKVSVMDSIAISNLPKQMRVTGSVDAEVKFPDVQSVSVNNLSDTFSLSKADKLSVDAINETLKLLDSRVEKELTFLEKIYKKKVKFQNLPVNGDPDQYLNVRLTNGKSFYTALGAAMGSIRIFQDSNGNAALGTIDSNGRLLVSTDGSSGGGTVTPNVLTSGSKAVETAGTAVVVGGDVSVMSVTIKSVAGNTGEVYVGDSSVDDTIGFILDAGESVSMDIDNLNKIYIDAANDGDKISFIAVSYV